MYTTYMFYYFFEAPTMPDNKIDRKRLWAAAARFGILTSFWSKWFNKIEPEEQWNLHYSDLTFEKADMPPEKNSYK